jgi:hypothetical protein
MTPILDAAHLLAEVVFGDHIAAVSHEDDFSRLREPYVLAQLVLELLDADDFHTFKVATGSYFVNFLGSTPPALNHPAG